MRTIKIITLLVTACLFSGCATLPKCGGVSAADESSERIIVYRKRALMGFGAFIPIAVDECKLGSLGNGGYLVGYFAPGKHEVAVITDFGKRKYIHEIEVVAGSDLYVRWSEVIDDVWIAGGMGGAIGHTVFTEVTRDVAESEVEKLKQIE